MTRMLLPLLLALSAACAHQTIAGTEIADTDENRAVLAVLDQARSAMEARDADAILAVVSEDYFEDSGTPSADDDYGYDELKTTILPESMAAAIEIKVTFAVHEVVVAGDSAHADIRYASRARLNMPSGKLWDSHREFNRVELTREAGGWRIISGL